MIRIKRGLDLPIAGAPRQAMGEAIEKGQKLRTVAVLGADYPGMKPTMLVQEGDQVRRGQALFEDKKTEGVLYTAPAAGRVSAINRGHKRVLQSVVIGLSGANGDEPFTSHPSTALASLSRNTVQQQLIASGDWTAIRTRPYGKVPAPGTVPHAIFVPAMDTNPLAANPDIIIADQLQAFRDGLVLLGRLTDGPVWVCRSPDSSLPAFSTGPGEQLREEFFAGPHPAGNPGTHIHFLSPVDARRSVWVVGYQDVIAMGRLFVSGRLHSERIIALTGPQMLRPRLVRTRTGASLEDLTDNELAPGDNRIISGSVFNGSHCQGPTAYLGRLANQVTVLREGRERQLLGYLSPGLAKHSVLGIYLSRLFKGRLLDFSASTNGSERAMVPLGQYEAVMPLDILPTQLLRSLIVGDMETAQALGALELVEEDLALCTYVCVGKYEYGPILRDNLTRMEVEG